jgi:ABC-2 type transport system ATP-binding protein
MTTPIIEIKSLDFEYPTKKALHNVSLSISAGSVTALVGENGAGKTTLMRCIAGLEIPFSGDVFVKSIKTTDQKPRQIIGFLSDHFGVYKDLTVRQCLRYVAGLYEISPDHFAKTLLDIEDYLLLGDKMHLKTEDLSRGQRQALGIAQILVFDPEIFILDEPASGLDPEARYRLSKLFLTLKQRGKTILVSSHILSELQDYCDDIIVIKSGHIVQHTKITNAKSLYQIYTGDTSSDKNTAKGNGHDA